MLGQESPRTEPAGLRDKPSATCVARKCNSTVLLTMWVDWSRILLRTELVADTQGLWSEDNDALHSMLPASGTEAAAMCWRSD